MEYQFKAEVKQVLDIVVNSLYTDKEIFVRELVSNASDASEKFRFNKLSAKESVDDASLKIEIFTDKDANTFTIQDYGIGMTESELVENLGTIAHSGSKNFLQALKEAKGQLNENLIGQFGVGFYSVFMVADKVDVYTKSEDGTPLHWSCDGSENFTISPCEKSERGTKIVATLKSDFKEFADSARIKEILEKYSAYVEFPIFINSEALKTRQAIWLKSKSELDDKEYCDFFKFQSHSFTDPIDWLHFKADAPVELNALIYVPAENPERLGLGKTECSVALYSKKVLIDSSPKDMFPEWLRFAHGVIDSSDIPLNISRESMQDSGLIKKLGKVVLKKFVKHLAEVANKDAQKYQKIYDSIGRFIKEGAAMDFENRAELAKLLRFGSSLFDDGKTTSLEDYVSRMKPDQKEIYYALGNDREAIETAPYIEAFKVRGLEVLYFYDPVDTFVAGNLGEFDKKPFVSIDTADLKLPDAPSKESDTSPISKEDLDKLVDWIKSTLGSERVSEVLTSGRLVESPVAALNADSINPQMRAILKAMNPDTKLPDPIVKFEINPKNPVIKNLLVLQKTDEKLAKLVLEQLFDNALLSAGILDNPRVLTKRMNEILAHIKA